MDPTDFRDIATGVFYLLGTVALIIGAPLALRRLFFEQAYSPNWQLHVQDCEVRQIQTGSGKGKFLYHAWVKVTNGSASHQRVLRTWAVTLLPDEEDFLKEFEVPPVDEDAVVKFFGYKGDPIRSTDALGPGRDFTFGSPGAAREKLEHTVRIVFTFKASKKRLFWPGYGKGTLFHAGAILVPVKLADIAHYSQRTWDDVE